FEVSAGRAWNSYEAPPPSLAMPGGGRLVGEWVLHPEDTDLPARLAVHSDGVKFWRRGGDGQWHETDTHRLRRARRVGGYDLAESWLRPAVPGTATSPIGTADGMLGWRVRKNPDDSRLAERIDGIQITLPESAEEPVAALTFPGTDAVVAVTTALFGYGL